MVLTLLTAGSVRAQLTFLSDSRSVSVSGWVQDADGNVSQSYTQSQNPSASFASFAGNVSGNASGPYYNNTIYSGSSASQNSSLTSAQISYSASVGAYQSYPAPFGHLYSDAGSTFSVSFSVSSPIQFSLTDDQHNWNPADAGESLILSSSTHGTIVTGPSLDPTGSGTDQYSGVLEPDQIYTLQISLTAQDYYSPNAYQGFDVLLNTPQLLPVPEPSSSLLLATGAVVTGLIALRRKRQAAAKS